MPTNGIRRPAREIPWPSGISEEARDLLIMFDKLKPGNSDAPHPDPDDIEGWRQFIAEWDDVILNAPGIYAAASREGISSETTRMGGATVHIAIPDGMRANVRGRVYLEMHGGALIQLYGEGARRGSLYEAQRLGVTTISVDYRVPPDAPYPAALDDCVAAYRGVLDEYDSSDVIVGGLSAGGNLAAALTLRARDEGLPLPAAVVLQSPQVDLTESGDSFETLLGVDCLLRGKISPMINLYAAQRDLRDPYLSPLFADFSRGYPPTFLQSGTRDLFLSNTVRMHRALRLAGVPADLHVWEGMPHGGFMGAPEDDEVTAEVRAFMDTVWSAPRDE